MLNFMEYGLRRYYDVIGWNQDRYYTSLDAVPARILRFPVPVGLNLALGKRISPVFKSAYSIRVSDRHSAAFMYSSVPVDLPPQPVHETLLPVALPSSSYLSFLPRSIRFSEPGTDALTQGGSVSGPNTPTTPALPSSWSQNYPYILFGRIFDDLHLEGLYSQRVGQNTLLTASALSDFKLKGDLENDDSNINAQLIYNRPEICAELSVNSDNSIIGGSVLGQVSTNWAVGTEVYYTGKERSGGFSLGARYKKEYDARVQSILTFVANPIMGHLNSAYSTTILKDMQMATQYDFNMYSFDADVSVGVEYAPAGRGQVLKVAVGLVEGISLRFDGHFKDALYSIGMSTSFGSDPKPSFGFQIQF
ncbi:hypothetical protein BASA50_008550 [Batrachochytrium salamandrivorans]|uniref:Mitochondrial distribution and morphology protein 10 n=1 Tax=Batrachochytrium salamandrivorans TaxID=1357716 RepID=A0ABQ8F4D3_9FUNG|nr:hypothetical protein BASA60_009074 [Batrachochytrium salamandrivorans]KAH6578005.1 hypothetical protein BASA62_000529 [Batrachochytrium salamandrivorans]KAH6589524.1 hypothetical protein BASA61_005587 [Batrachochytrium salamandrivorans]KAH6591693.1 hypothetical protein BASA50_008550 [Batrachochytrium salamandrivorans]KAH9264407.1 hypothetical protein BASA83_012105 [Batrachochytrium salamandrivorans]